MGFFHFPKFRITCIIRNINNQKNRSCPSLFLSDFQQLLWMLFFLYVAASAPLNALPVCSSVRLMPAVAVPVHYKSCYKSSIAFSASVIRCSFRRQRFCAEICTDSFVINARHSLAALLAAEALYILGIRYKALLCQHCRTIHIFQQRKAALRPYLCVGVLHQLLLVVFQIINVTHSPTSASSRAK